MVLDRHRRAIGAGAAFDDVGIQSPLGQESGIRNRLGFVAENFDEHAADNLALRLRFDDAAQFRQKAFAGVDDVQIGPKMLAEAPTHRFFLAAAQEAIVDKDARELRSDRLDQERRDN
jgi:hypothetical protein